MKTNYLPKNKKILLYKRVTLFLLGIFILGTLIFSVFDSILLRVVSPIWQGESWIMRTVSKEAGIWRGRERLLEENFSLKEKVQSLEIELASLRTGENSLALLGRSSDEEGIVAGVLTHPPKSPYDILVIDAGVQDGVEIGERVFLPEGPEVGVISDTFTRTAKVKLFSSSGVVTPAVLERHAVSIELEGLGAGNFKIIVPRDTEVQVGDRVLSAYVNSSLLAIIEDVEPKPTHSF